MQTAHNIFLLFLTKKQVQKEKVILLGCHVIYIALFFILLFWAFISIVYWTIKNGISPMPTSFGIRTNIIELQMSLQPGVIYELGSGWGTLAFPLANKFTTHNVIAYETSKIPYFYCLLKSLVSKQTNLQFKRSDFYKESLEDASLVFCYLYPAAMQKLKIKFDKELPNGCFVVTNTFSIPGCQPIETLQINDLYKSKIFIYKW